MNAQERLERAREAFDLEALQNICMAPQGYFEKYGTEYTKNGGKGGFAFYFHEEPESDLLAVAHMDSVQAKHDFGYCKFVSGREIIFSPQLDDRLGVYTICEWLPKLGIKVNLLLTTDEETGRSTAGVFQTDKQYRWMFQFDRMGDDVVMYQYKTPEAVKMLEECRFKSGLGSASDISKLEDLGCLGFNFGIGYQDAHSRSAWADLEVAIEQVAKFTDFYERHKDEFMAYEKKKLVSNTSLGSSGYYSGGYRSYDGHNDPWDANYENEYGRRVDGVWYGKLIWDERIHLWVQNEALYKRHSDTKPATREEILNKNTRWSKGEYVLAEGRFSEVDVLAIAKGVLIVTNPPPEGFLNGSPKVLTATTSESSSKPANGAVIDRAQWAAQWDIDEACECRHSRFVHRRRVFRHGVRSDDACDFWKCSCISFRAAEPMLGGL